MMDHFFQIPPVGPAEQEMLEGYGTLHDLAGRTENVTLGTLVTGVTYRNLGILAKTVSPLDVLSGGRAVPGIGEAWFEREHEGLGVPFPPLAEHCERLDRDYDELGRTTPSTVHLAPGAQSPRDVIRFFEALADAGVTHVIVNLPNVHEPAPLEAFAKEIIPAVAGR